MYTVIIFQLQALRNSLLIRRCADPFDRRGIRERQFNYLRPRSIYTYLSGMQYYDKLFP